MAIIESSPQMFDPSMIDVYSADEHLREQYYRYLIGQQSKGHEHPMKPKEHEDLLLLNAIKERRGDFKGRYPKPEEKRMFAAINRRVMNDEGSEAEQEFIRDYHRWQSLEIADFPELPDNLDTTHDIN